MAIHHVQSPSLSSRLFSPSSLPGIGLLFTCLNMLPAYICLFFSPDCEPSVHRVSLSIYG